MFLSVAELLALFVVTCSRCLAFPNKDVVGICCLLFWVWGGAPKPGAHGRAHQGAPKRHAGQLGETTQERLPDAALNTAPLFPSQKPRPQLAANSYATLPAMHAHKPKATNNKVVAPE